jgi:Concanavalin A-like lectin/glucanases superfamily/Immunoglobulin domain
MKKKLLIGLLPLAVASAGMGQVINFHDDFNYHQVPGYAVLYFGQGAYSDPGHNVWNGFGASAGNGPGSTLFYGGTTSPTGGNQWNNPQEINAPEVIVATNNPGNPYAAYGNPPTLTASVGTTTWGIAGGQIGANGDPTGLASGNANSDGSYSPITLGISCTALAPDNQTNGTVQGTPSWIFAESIQGNGASPQFAVTLSNVPSSTYELYLYGASLGDNGGVLFSVNNGTAHNGINATLNKTIDGTPCNNFVEGDNYVIFQNVVPDANHVITITGSPNPLSGANGNLGGQADFNGLQLINTGPPPTLLIQNSTPAQNVYSGGTAQFSVALQIGSSPSYKWQSIIGGVTNNLTDAGQITGSGTANLSISSVGAGNVGLYQCMVIAGGVTNVTTPAPLSVLHSTAINLVQRGDPATSYNDAIGAPGGNSAADAVDGTLTSFINFGASGNLTTFTGPAGFVITPQASSTIATGLRFIVASSHPEDDPADYLLEGSNDGGATFTTISSGPLSLPVQRNPGGGAAVNITNQILQEVTFANTSGYTTYRLSAANIRNNSAPTYGMQIGEVQILGTLTPIAPIIAQQPATNATLFAGSTLAASVAPSGATPYTFQWYYNGSTKVTGGTNATLVMPNLQLANSGTYSCIVSNPYGSITSSNLTLAVVTPNHYQQIIQALNPIGFWSLEETNGSTSWDYVGQHNGTYNGGFLQAQPGVPDAGFAPTNTSYSVIFNGSSGYIDIPENAIPVKTNLVTGFVNYPTLTNLNVTGPLTMIGWILSSASGRFTTFFGHGDPSYRMDYDNSGHPHFADFNNDATASFSVGDSKWHLIVGVYTGVSNLCYVDGALAAQALTGGQGAGDAFDLWIGGDPQYGTGRLFQGNMAQCALLNYALTGAQVFQIFNNAGALPQISLTASAFSGDENGSATITANPPVGSVPLTVQWWDVAGGVTNLLVGQTNLSLTLTNLQTSQSGNQYFIVASNLFGTGASGVAPLNVLSGPPTINPDLPTTVYAIYGGPLVLSIGETGTLPFTNQWYFGSTPLTDGGRVSGSHSNALIINDLQPSDLGNYQVLVTNIDGSAASQTAQLVSLLPSLSFNGTVGWNLNGGASFITTNVTTNSILMTDGNGSEARSAWFQSPVDVSAFRATWIYQTSGGADGTTFCLQDSTAGTSALGSGGGALGYGGPDAETVPGITPSVALAMNIYNGHVQGIHVYTDGIGANSSGGVNYDSTAPVSITGGDPIQFVINYMSGVMNVALTDLSTHATFGTNYIVNIPSVLGTGIGFVGFTAGTGGVASTQVVSNFTYVGVAALSLKVASPNLVITWPFVSGQYVLQQNSAVNGSHPWANVGAPVTVVNGQLQVSVPLPSSPAYYRLQLQ